jgi:hypothetical protein
MTIPRAIRLVVYEERTTSLMYPRTRCDCVAGVWPRAKVGTGPVRNIMTEEIRRSTSGILDAFRYYPPDVFGTIWARMDHAADNGVIVAVDEVYRELEKKDDVAFQWLKRHDGMVVAVDEEMQHPSRRFLEHTLA